MGFQFNKRIKLGKGLGLNVSRSGVRPTYRNKSGSLSSKGFSIKTGIRGVTYRKTFGKAKNSGCLLTLILFLLFGFVQIIISCKNEDSKPINQWYQGGTLHKAKITDWKNATKENKLATCGDFCANTYKDNSLNEIKTIATNLMICIDEAVKDVETSGNSEVSEIASLCLILIEN